ncbi:MAG: hypothetical protein OHK0039_13450 [Bacteroidia bacterium]
MHLQPYLDGLLADLRARHGRFPAMPDLRALAPDPDYPDEVEGAIAYLYGPEYAMADLFDLGVEAFPPVLELSQVQAADLAQAILDLWRSISIEADLPPGMPLHLAYPVLVQRWAGEPVAVVQQGSVHVEFCTYEPGHCPWPQQWCMCRDRW